MTTVDELAQIIRQVDGNQSLGAGALAEAIIAKLPHIAARQPVGEPVDYIEFLDRQNDSLRRAIHAIMAKLAFLLDEDQFADVDAIALAAGVSPPGGAK